MDDVDKRFFRILVEVYILVSRKCSKKVKSATKDQSAAILLRYYFLRRFCVETVPEDCSSG